MTVFLSGKSFLCCCTANATDLRELFLLSGVSYPTLLPDIWHSTANATDLREPFLLSGVSFSTLLPDIWYSTASATDLGELFYSQVFLTLHFFPTCGTTWFYKASLGAGSSSLKVAGPPTKA